MVGDAVASRAPLAAGLALASALAAAACAPKAPPSVGAAPAHPEYLFPAVPAGSAAGQASRIDLGWRLLQAGDPRGAEREFSSALEGKPPVHPAETGMGYVALARRQPADAVDRFERALTADAAYAPALVGRGLAMLALDRDADALASFEAALAADSSLAHLRARIDVLRVRATQARIARAREAAEAGRLDEAREAYEAAIAASPDSAFLHRDLAGVDEKAGRDDRALDGYRRAVDLDPTDARSHARIGALLAARDDAAASLSAYERARDLDPAEVPDAVLARARTRAALAGLPAEYRAIPDRAAATRADVAALIGHRLRALLAQAPRRQAIVTDVRGHWAEAWIDAVVSAGVMDALPNYAFDPGGRVRRGELAQTVSRVLALVSARAPASADRWREARVPIGDVPEGHLSHPAVAAAVASGVMPLRNGAFDLLGPVTGADAVGIVSRLEALARP